MSELYKTIELLCAQRGITGYRLCKDVGIQPSIITDLRVGRKNSMKVETADKIASYFGVSVGYLLGTEQKEKTPTPEGERPITYDDFTFAMQNEAKELTEMDKQILLSMAKQLNDARKKKDGESG